MVNLADLEKGDTVVWRDGQQFIVTKIEYIEKYPWPYKLSFKDHREEYYLQDGHYRVNKTPRLEDIVKIIKGNTEMVDLAKAKVGDIAVLRNNSIEQIEAISFTESKVYPFFIKTRAENQTYMQNGVWIKGETNPNDIIKIIPNPYNKTLAEIIEDGVKTARPKPKKYLFKGETEPRELKIGDKLIHLSGSLYKVEYGQTLNELVGLDVDTQQFRSFDRAEDFLFVHETDKVVKHKGNIYGVLKYESPDQFVVNVHDSLEIWSRDKCDLI